MLEPVEMQFETMSGESRTYILSKFPAIAGREIITKYPTTMIPKASDYSDNEAVMLKLMSFVAAVLPNGDVQQLTTRALIDNHVPDYETLMKIEKAMLELNSSFFRKGLAWISSEGLKAKAQQWITSTLTGLLGQLLAQSKQVTKTSKKT